AASCAPAPPPPEWAEEAAAEWLRALGRGDPPVAWELLSGPAQRANGPEERFRSEVMPRLRRERAPWGRAPRLHLLRPAPDHAVAVVGADARAEAALPLAWEGDDWRVELGAGPEPHVATGQVEAPGATAVAAWRDGRRLAEGDIPSEP